MPQPRKNFDELVVLYEGGLSVPKISKLCGKSISCVYKILKRRGVEFRPLPKGGSICTVDGCGEPIKARGLCSRHSAQFYAHGKVISGPKIKVPNGNRKCTVEGCERKYRANGYCQGHLMQFQKHGEIVSVTLAPRSGLQHSNGYILILKPDHPMANRRGYVKRANLVWEENTGQVVIPPALVHHKNGNKGEDFFENLEYFHSDLEHQLAHHISKGHRGFIPGGIL